MDDWDTDKILISRVGRYQYFTAQILECLDQMDDRMKDIEYRQDKILFTLIAMICGTTIIIVVSTFLIALYPL